MNYEENYIFEINQIQHKYLNFTIGKMISKNLNQIEQKQQLPPKQPKINDEERKEKCQNQTQRKHKSELQIKSNLLYLHMLLLIIDSESQIIFKRIERKSSKEDNSIINFHCTSIISEGYEIFNFNKQYLVEQNSNSLHSTIAIDLKTGYPVVDNLNTNKQNSNDQCRIQQHILFHRINKLLEDKELSIDYKIHKKSTKGVSSLEIKTFLDFDEKREFISFERSFKDDLTYLPNFKYQQNTNALIDFISYFLDSKNGITQKVVIGDNLKGSYGLEITNELTIIGREIFLIALWNYKNLNISMKTIFEEPEKYIYPYFQIVWDENENKLNDFK